MSHDCLFWLRTRELIQIYFLLSRHQNIVTVFNLRSEQYSLSFFLNSMPSFKKSVDPNLLADQDSHCYLSQNETIIEPQHVISNNVVF